jgi:hypothetical protein
LGFDNSQKGTLYTLPSACQAHVTKTDISVFLVCSLRLSPVSLLYLATMFPSHLNSITTLSNRSLHYLQMLSPPCK